MQSIFFYYPPFFCLCGWCYEVAVTIRAFWWKVNGCPNWLEVNYLFAAFWWLLSGNLFVLAVVACLLSSAPRITLFNFCFFYLLVSDKITVCLEDRLLIIVSLVAFCIQLQILGISFFSSCFAFVIRQLNSIWSSSLLITGDWSPPDSVKLMMTTVTNYYRVRRCCFCVNFTCSSLFFSFKCFRLLLLLWPMTSLFLHVASF